MVGALSCFVWGTVLVMGGAWSCNGLVLLHRIWAGSASPAKGLLWHSIVLPQLAEVVSNVAALLEAMEDILTMVDLSEPAEKMHLPIPNVDLAYCKPQARPPT